MYSLLIADDEKWVKLRLSQTIDWNSLGIETVTLASTGTEAENFILQNKPHIVLTDIKMPGRTGLELMQTAWENHIPCKFILISGYAEFTYAQQAIQLGAVEYLLKPVKDEAVKNAIEKCISQIEKSSQQQSLLTENHDLLLNKIYIKLLNNAYSSQEEFLKEAASIQLNEDSLYHGCLVIRYTSRFQKNTENLQQLQTLLQNLIQEFHEEQTHTKIRILNALADQLCCVITTSLEQKEASILIDKLARDIEYSASAFNHYGFAIGFGHLYPSLYQLSTSYHEALTALRYRIYTNHSSVCNIQDLIYTDFQLKVIYPQNLDVVALHIKNNKIDEALHVLELYTSSIPTDCTPADLQLMALNCVNGIIHHLLGLGISQKRLSFIPMLLLTHLQTVYHVQDISEMLRKIVESIIIDAPEEVDFTLQNILLYIKNNYHLPITSKSVAEEFHYNPSYFSKMFSDEVGQPFTKYLALLRIEKAKRLLAVPGIKISQIARDVGFDDYPYFVRIFKQYTGMGPSSYRDSLN